MDHLQRWTRKHILYPTSKICNGQFIQIKAVLGIMRMFFDVQYIWAIGLYYTYYSSIYYIYQEACMIIFMSVNTVLNVLHIEVLQRWNWETLAALTFLERRLRNSTKGLRNKWITLRVHNGVHHDMRRKEKRIQCKIEEELVEYFSKRLHLFASCLTGQVDFRKIDFLHDQQVIYFFLKKKPTRIRARRQLRPIIKFIRRSNKDNDLIKKYRTLCRRTRWYDLVTPSLANNSAMRCIRFGNTAKLKFDVFKTNECIIRKVLNKAH